MSEIYVDSEALTVEFSEMRDTIESFKIPPLSDYTTDATILGIHYILVFYDAFKDLINTYLDMILRDAAVIGDMAIALQMYDNLYANVSEYNDLFPAYEHGFDRTSIRFSVDGDFTLSDTWEFNKRDCDILIAEVLTNIYDIMQNQPIILEKISSYSSSDSFRGEAAEAAKSYFNSVHSIGCRALFTIAQNAFIWINVYWLTYRTSRDFEEDGLNRCWIGKVELTELIAQLLEKYNLLEEWHPQIAQHNSILSSETAGTYDYYNSLTGLFSLPDYIQDIISRCNNVIDTVESLEGSDGAFAIIIRPHLEHPTQLFCNYAQELRNIGTRFNYAHPPVDLNASHSLESYTISFCTLQTRNEIRYIDVICTGAEEMCEVNTEVSLDAAAEERGSAIVRNSIAIVGAVGSIIVTAGADAPCAVMVIATSTMNIASLAFHGANLAENYEEIQLIHQGELDPNANNFVRESLFWFIEDESDRQRVYEYATTTVDTTAGCLNGANAIYLDATATGSTITLEQALATSGVRTSASTGIRYGVNCVTGDATVTQIIMVPANAAINYSVDTRTNIPYADYNYNNAADAALHGFRTPTSFSSANTYFRIIVSNPGTASSATIDNNTSTYTTEWQDNYNEAYGYGLVGGGFSAL